MRLFVLFGLLLGSTSLYAAPPACMDGGQTLSIDNAQILKWKTSTPNQFLARGYVQGTVSQVFPDRNGHKHFEIKLGPNPKDIIEVVFNLAFGKLPEIPVGMNVSACGDYITSFAPGGGYDASPSGALIHWVHKNPKGKGHDSGFITLNGVTYGYGKPIPALFDFEEGFMPTSMELQPTQ